jgi:hypothetical protein
MNAMLPLFATTAKPDKAASILGTARAFVPHINHSPPLDRKLWPKP